MPRTLVEAVNTGWLIVHDPILVRQFPTFERKYKGENGKPFLEHAQGCHDDDLFAMAMCWTTLHDLENTALRIAKKYKPPSRGLSLFRILLRGTTSASLRWA